MPKRVLASQFKKRKTGSRNCSLRKDYDAAFDAAVEIEALEEQLKNPHLSSDARGSKEKELVALEDKITRGKSRFAADQHRELTKAAIEIIQESQPEDQITRADLIRAVKEREAHVYKDAAGRERRYTDRRLRAILDRLFERAGVRNRKI